METFLWPICAFCEKVRANFIVRVSNPIVFREITIPLIKKKILIQSEGDPIVIFIAKFYGGFIAKHSKVVLA